MKIKEIKQEDISFKPIKIEITFESLNEIKSLIAYLNLSADYVKQYYHNLPNNFNSFYAEVDSISIKIDKIENIDFNLLNFLNNIALSSEK